MTSCLCSCCPPAWLYDEMVPERPVKYWVQPSGGLNTNCYSFLRNCKNKEFHTMMGLNIPGSWLWCSTVGFPLLRFSESPFHSFHFGSVRSTLNWVECLTFLFYRWKIQDLLCCPVRVPQTLDGLKSGVVTASRSEHWPEKGCFKVLLRITKVLFAFDNHW